MCAIGTFIGAEKISPEVPFIQKVSVSAAFPVALSATFIIVFTKQAREYKETAK